METALTVICLFVILPAMVLWYMDRQRNRDRDPADTQAPESLEALSDRARRMEKRIDALEKILDAEAPDWRARDERQ